MAKIKINYNWNIVSLKWLKTLKKEEWVSSASMKKDYWFTKETSAKLLKNKLEKWRKKSKIW